jgi:hypothetical protein
MLRAGGSGIVEPVLGSGEGDVQLGSRMDIVKVRLAARWLVLVIVAALATAAAPASAGQGGTTLSASLTASGHTLRTYSWTISKTASPDTLDVPTAQSGTSQFTVTVHRDMLSDGGSVDGQVCVTNGGIFPTENLRIAVVVQRKLGPGQVRDEASAAVDVGAAPVLAPGESHCYRYAVAFSPAPGAAYGISAKIAITNFEGWMSGDGNCPGAGPCPHGVSLTTGLDLTSSSGGGVNETITVIDTNGGSWSFSDSGSVIYTETFTCGDNDQGMGPHPNVATILETGQSASASVWVNCAPPPDPGEDD